jgi:predicted DNA-binding transcriptional regulator AlpA
MKLNDPPPLLLPAREAARLCAVSERTWRSWDSAGQIPRAVLVGRSKFWRRRELEAWIGEGCPDRKTWQTIFLEQR